MKRIYLIMITAIITCCAFGQAPEQMSFQAVIRNSSNALLVNATVGMRITILQSSALGISVYSETQRPVTNQNGLVSLQVGAGTTADKFSIIDWSKGPYFIKTETDPTGGGNYTITGISQLMSVPYALYAKTAGPNPIEIVGPKLVFLDNTLPNYINFGAAASFTLFTNVGAVANTGTTNLNGNIGTNAGAIAGFGSPSYVNGVIHNADPLATQAAKDLLLAYNQLHNSVPTNTTHAVVFGGGETLVPGVYSISSAGSLNGQLILDGQSNPNAQFIFKIGGAFSTTANSKVALVNGADPANIFWVAEGAISMAANTFMNGVMVANTGAVSMATGGTLNGRLYSTTGAIALNTVNALGLTYIIPIRVLPNGEVVIKRTLSVGANLNVDSSVYLNRSAGGTVNYGPFKVDRLSPTSLSGTLTVDQATILNTSLTVNGPVDLNSRLFVNNLSPTKLTGTLQTDGVANFNAALNINNLSPALLTGTLQVNKNALFQDTVLLNSTHSSSSATTGALVVNGGLGVGGNFNAGGTSSFGGNVSFKAPVYITDPTQSTSTTTGALIVSGGLGVAKRLNVGDSTSFASAVVVTGVTSLNNSMESSATNNGSLVVAGGVGIAKSVNIGGTATVSGAATINGGATINNALTVNGAGSYVASFVNSTNSNGISIQLNVPTASSANNFATFLRGDGTSIGSIQGQLMSEMLSDKGYLLQMQGLDVAVSLATIANATGIEATVLAGIGVAAAATSTTPCVGLGVCETVPIVSLIVQAGATLVAAIATNITNAVGLAFAVKQKLDFTSNSAKNIGVTYQSGSADYAEWLPKADPAQKLLPGYIVGIKNGLISLNAIGTDKLFVVSTKPLVLGNMPLQGKESTYEKVAFMGQVPVHILGKVNVGDYILPSGNNDGFGKAVSPAKMQPEDYVNIVGMAWSASTNDTYNEINVAIGLNAGDISKVVVQQHTEIEALKNKINETNNILAKLLPGYKEAAGLTENTPVNNSSAVVSNNTINRISTVNKTIDASRIIYFDISSEQFVAMMDLAKQMFLDHGGNENTDPFWKKMKTDASYKSIIMEQMKDRISKVLQTHKNINGQFSINK